MSSILRALRTLPIYVVTGKTEYNTFGANAAVPCIDTGTLNDLLNAGGALGTQITDITGLTAWKDYIPVQNETGRTVPFAYDANGYFPIKKVSGNVSNASNALLHFNGANNGTVFTDERGSTSTRPGNAVTQTTTKKFGTAALQGAAHASQGGVIQCVNTSLSRWRRTSTSTSGGAPPRTMARTVLIFLICSGGTPRRDFQRFLRSVCTSTTSTSSAYT